MMCQHTILSYNTYGNLWQGKLVLFSNSIEGSVARPFGTSSNVYVLDNICRQS